jgi:hypothetical protein
MKVFVNGPVWTAVKHWRKPLSTSTLGVGQPGEGQPGETYKRGPHKRSCGPAPLVACALTLISLLCVPPASAATRGRLLVVTAGLPSSTAPSLVISGSGLRRAIRSSKATLSVPVGRYVVHVRRVAIARSSGHIRQGAAAFPAPSRVVVVVRAHHTTTARVRYGAIVNPAARRLPRRIVGVLGDPASPKAVLLSARAPAPRVGTILTSGPLRAVPDGLISRVTKVSRQGSLRVISLVPVPITDAVPQLDYAGNLALTAARSAAATVVPSARDRSPGSGHAASASCVDPKLLSYGAHLDSVNVRQAFLGAWPPQFRLTLAVRTSESIGVALAAAGINCDFDLGQIGPFSGALPVGPIVVPVYATFPVKAGIHINGTLNAGTFHVASTTVAHVAAGFDENAASLSEEGANVWVTGAPSVSGSVSLSASIGVQGGIGIARGANVHVEADFGPEFSWSSGRSCALDVALGSLSAGVSVFRKQLNTPSFTPFKWHIWDGCQPSASTTTAPSPPNATQPPPATVTPASPQNPSPPPGGGSNPPPPSGGTEGFYIQDSIYGGTWARTDPYNGTWYPHATPPPNGAYWYPNGLGVAVSCAESAAAYPVVINGQHETWSWWAHVTDGKWVPVVVFSTVWNDGLPAGLAHC